MSSEFVFDFNSESYILSLNAVWKIEIGTPMGINVYLSDEDLEDIWPYPYFHLEGAMAADFVKGYSKWLRMLA